MIDALSWPLLAKQHDFWKTKSWIAIAWAFYASIACGLVATPKPNPFVLQHLRCVLCYPIAALLGGRKGILSYKLPNEISLLWKHLETNHHKVWIEGGEYEKNAPKH
jgi:hypothetical protein